MAKRRVSRYAKYQTHILLCVNFVLLNMKFCINLCHACSYEMLPGMDAKLLINFLLLLNRVGVVVLRFFNCTTMWLVR